MGNSVEAKIYRLFVQKEDFLALIAIVVRKWFSGAMFDVNISAILQPILDFSSSPKRFYQDLSGKVEKSKIV